jgi:putative iron-dependent peroxidase
VVDGFQYDTGRDLTGFEDGTENPQGEKAIAAGIVQGKGEGLDGSSFVAVQQWVHDFARFEALSPKQQDESVGRRKSDNEELPGAPPSAHVKRTAQESFDPEAFVLRRSMPWADGVRVALTSLPLENLSTRSRLN